VLFYQGFGVLLLGVHRTDRLGVLDSPRVGQTVREGSMDCPSSSDCPEARVGRSVFLGCGTGGSVASFEPSVRGLQTVR
jgi:hypothetical protein